MQNVIFIFTYFYRLKTLGSKAWWYMSVIPAFWRKRQEGLSSQASLGYIMRPYLRKK
jgi:hypothetical protein